MTFKLPDLPYAYDALQPYMSAETLQFHHDKHHQAYVDNGNKLIVGSVWKANPSKRSASPLSPARTPASSTTSASTTTTSTSGTG